MVQQFDPTVYVSLAFLFGIAAQFRAMEGEAFLRRVTSSLAGKVGTMLAVVIVASIFSPLILNDVVIIILTPVVLGYAKRFRIDVAPLLVAEVTFTNIASTLTPLGNPQNILLWNESGATFLQFVSGTALPVSVSAAIALAVLFPLRKRLSGTGDLPSGSSSRNPAVYLAFVIAILIAADFTGLQAYLALGASFAVGFAFTWRSLWPVLVGFDFRSLLILYVFVGSITLLALVVGPELSPYAAPVARGSQPYSALFMGGVSNLISNVPATQLVLSVTSVTSQVAPKIAVQAGLAGNIDPVSSFAYLLALLIARRAGMPLKRTILLQFLVGTVAFLPAFL
jgi:Na+/H+ antiporter NhaD/arsenite permease-like protein